MTTDFKDFADQINEDEPRRGMDRMPPQDNDAEQAVLGSMLTSKDAIADVLETVKAADFYHPAHEYIFSAILDLYGRGEPADPITVANELNRTGMLQRARGPLYLHDLYAKVSVAANAGYYARIVREKAILRRLVEASLKIAQLGYAGEGDVADIVDRAQAAVYSVTDGNTAEDYQPLSELLEATLDEMEALSSRSGEMAGVPTGFIELDELTNGLHGGQMVILAARPAVGKALALDTPLPTPTGWTTMGEVQVGDELLGADGRPTRVVAATEVMQDHECYEISFSDGTTVVADANHQWVATSRAARRAAGVRRAPSYYFPNDVVERAKRIARMAQNEPDELVTMSEIVAEVGQEFRHVLHAVAQEVGIASRVGRLASGSEREYIWSTPAYRRRTILRALAERVAKPKGGWSAVSHPRVVTTAEMAELVTLADGRANWSVHIAKPLALADRHLPLPPYALGVWLGDGHSRGARFTSADPEVADLVRASGVEVRCQTGLNYGLGSTNNRNFQRTLRQLGLWGQKHIPNDYLRASHPQRLDLLRGLLDTDGTVTGGGSVQLALTNRKLAMDARELIHSLGMRCSFTIKTVAGRNTDSSKCYILNFTTDDEVFGLPRKQATHRDRRRSHKWVTDRYVRSIKPVPSVPVRCVEVDNRDHLYLASEAMIPTHNSTLGLDFARACSIKNGMTSAIFSLEMSKVEITMRLLSAEAQIPLNHIRKGTMSEEDWQRVANKMATISSAPLFIDDSPNLTMMEIRAKARRLKQKHDLKLIVIDYLQLMSSGKKVESRQLEVSEFSRQIKLLAKELSVPVVAMSQLNRGPEQRTDKKPMVSDLRESGCLTADTRILRADTGAEITIGELCRTGQRNIPVWSLDEHNRLVPATMTHAFSSGVKEVFRMKLASGREIKATANHPFLTLGGWKPLGELTVGSRLATPRRLADPLATQRGDDDDITILAHMIGDGSFVIRSHQKFIPEWVFGLPLDQVQDFVGHLWATDGSVRRSGERKAAIYYASTSRRLADDLARLLLRCGIRARISTIEKSGHRDCYHLHVSGVEQQLVFCRTIPVPGARGFAARALVPVLENVVANTNVDTIPPELWIQVRQGLAERGMSHRAFAAAMGTQFCGSTLWKQAPSRARLACAARILDDAILEGIVTSDVAWDTVIAIDPIGEQEVFDATVPGPHNFIADGIIVHNSLEQDADIVILLHREDIYDKESPRLGEADFIVAKNRNGPTRTVVTAFQGHYSRFVDMQH